MAKPAKAATATRLRSIGEKSPVGVKSNLFSFRFSRCCHLISALWFGSCRVEPGPGD